MPRQEEGGKVDLDLGKLMTRRALRKTHGLVEIHMRVDKICSRKKDRELNGTRGKEKQRTVQVGTVRVHRRDLGVGNVERRGQRRIVGQLAQTLLMRVSSNTRRTTTSALP